MLGALFDLRLAVSVGLGLVVGAFLIIHSIYPGPTVDTTTLGLLVLLVVALTIPFADSITFPDGTSIKLAQAIPEASTGTFSLLQKLSMTAAMKSATTQIRAAVPPAHREGVMRRFLSLRVPGIGVDAIDWAIEAPALELPPIQARETVHFLSSDPMWSSKLKEKPSVALAELASDLESAKAAALRGRLQLDPNDTATIDSVRDLCLQAAAIRRLRTVDAASVAQLGRVLVQGLEQVIG